MREPTRTERFLMAVLGALVLLLVVLIVVRSVRGTLDRNRAEELRLRGLLEEYNSWIAQAEIWKEREQWLLTHQPLVWNREKSEADFAQMLQETVAAEGMQILGQRLAGSQEVGKFVESSIQMTIKGTTEAIIRWLHRLQQPGEFLSVRQLNLRLDGDKKNLRAEVGVVRFYRREEEFLEQEPAEGKVNPSEEVPDQELPNEESSEPTQNDPSESSAAEEAETQEGNSPPPTDLQPLTPSEENQSADEIEKQVGQPPQLPLDDPLQTYAAEDNAPQADDPIPPNSEPTPPSLPLDDPQPLDETKPQE